MRMLATLVLIVLAGCSTVERSAPTPKPRLARIDRSLMTECPALTVGRIPKGEQDFTLVLPYVLRDLENYKVCRYRHGKLIEAVKARDAIQGRR